MGLSLDKPAFPVDKGRCHQVFVYRDFIEPHMWVIQNHPC